MHFPLAYATLATMASLYLTGVGAQTSSCWASAANVAASYGPLSDLRLDATPVLHSVCLRTWSEVLRRSPGFGFQSAAFLGNFASNVSCASTFNALVTDCYGTASPTRPTTLGGVRTDPGGAELVISFGDGARL